MGSTALGISVATVTVAENGMMVVGTGPYGESDADDTEEEVTEPSADVDAEESAGSDVEVVAVNAAADEAALDVEV